MAHADAAMAAEPAMIASLRAAHRALWILLALLLPVLLAVSLAVRTDSTPINRDFHLP